MASRMVSRVIIAISSTRTGGRSSRPPGSSVSPVSCKCRLALEGSGSLQSVLALLPIAGAELVGLQRVQHADHFVRVTTDVEVGDVDESNDTLRVDDER